MIRQMCTQEGSTEGFSAGSEGRSLALCTSDISSLSQIIKQNRQAWAFLFKKINFCKI